MSMIGAVYKLKRAMLGNPKGTIGFVYEEYPDFDDKSKLGVSIIFKNGRYDGFSAKEQEDYLEFCYFDMGYANYNFENVGKLSQDFHSGYWTFKLEE